MNTKNLTLKQSGFIWNSLAGIINASEAVIILMVVTRVSGLEMAGIVTIAFSIGNLLMTVGKYGMRNFQVTDVNDSFSFNDYFSSRIVTVFVMLMLTVIYLLYAFICLGYSWQKSAVVLLICMIYMVESLEDVFWGNYQRHGHLDFGGKVFAYRWLLQMAIIILLLLLQIDVVWSLFLALCSGALFTYIYNRRTQALFQTEKLCFISKNVMELLRCCFPLFLAAFLSNYIVNAPKYAIDALMDESSQACYGFIAMPVFVVSLVSNFFYQPILLELANIWESRQFTLMRKMIRRQCAFIFVLTFACLIGAYFLGIPFLNILFNADLADLKMELLILLLGGGFFALASFFIVVMATMRIQTRAIYVYSVVAALAMIFSPFFVKVYGLTGAAWVYTFLQFALTVVLYFMTCFNIKINDKKGAQYV